MNPELYQRLASRTECDQLAATRRLSDVYPADPAIPGSEQLLPVRVNHAVIGLMGEVGELAAAVEKWVYYGGKLDVTNLKEEAGDCLWYLAQLLNVLDLDMGEVMFSNIMKLKARYPEKFSTWESANRDLEAERRALEKVYPSGLPAYDPAQAEDARQRADYEAKKARCQAGTGHGNSPPPELDYDHKVIRHDTGPTNPNTDEVTKALQKATDAVVAGAARGHIPAVHAGPGRDWCCSCGRINAPYDNECGACGKISPLLGDAAQPHSVHDWDSKEVTARCRKCRAYRHMESGCMPCPVRPYIVQGESSPALLQELATSVKEAGLPVQPHPTHDWDGEVNAHCRKCGAYKHLGSGFLRCRGAARVEDQPRVQNGHGWAEPEILEGEY